MWPAKLAERLILSMCPSEVCVSCGAPRRRIERTTGLVDQRGRQVDPITWASGMAHVDVDTGGQLGAGSLKKSGGLTTTTTIGWTSCDCAAGFRPGIVLDPFSGASTTPAVADLHGRDAIGLELNQASLDLYDRRRAECARALFDSPIPDTHQGVLQL